MKKEIKIPNFTDSSVNVYEFTSEDKKITYLYVNGLKSTFKIIPEDLIQFCCKNFYDIINITTFSGEGFTLIAKKYN